MATLPAPEHNLWRQCFNVAERQELLDEDTAAFSRVTGILLVVVTVGVLLAMLSVFAICAAG